MSTTTVPKTPPRSPPMGLFFQFNLTQSVSQATHEKGHILDWLVHKSDDSIVRSTSVTSAIASDHLFVISHLVVSVPRPPPSFVMKRSIRAVIAQLWRTTPKAVSLSAEDDDSHLRCVLDKHAPATRQKVPSRRSAPIFQFSKVSARNLGQISNKGDVPSYSGLKQD